MKKQHNKNNSDTPHIPPDEEKADIIEQLVEDTPDPAAQQPQTEAEEYLAGWQRCRADYENLRKETDQRTKDAVKYGTEQLLMELAPTLDHFNYAFAGIPPEERDSAWVKGMEYIQSNFVKILEAHGVEMIKTVGEQFDPHLHEAVEEIEEEGKTSGTIAQEVGAGFLLNGKVIRVAKVKVIK